MKNFVLCGIWHEHLRNTTGIVSQGLLKTKDYLKHSCTSQPTIRFHLKGLQGVEAACIARKA